MIYKFGHGYSYNGSEKIIMSTSITIFSDEIETCIFFPLIKENSFFPNRKLLTIPYWENLEDDDINEPFWNL